MGTHSLLAVVLGIRLKIRLITYAYFSKCPDLNSIKIWHDKTGRTPSESSWYLRHVIINDLQTRENFFFICDKWFALDKDDGLIERSLMLSSDYDKTRLNYLLKKQMKNNLRDNHLWLSIFARPVQSSFTRLDRLTCCFLL